MKHVLSIDLHYIVAQAHYESFFGAYLLMRTASLQLPLLMRTASLQLHSDNIANIVTTMNYSNMYYAM